MPRLTPADLRRMSASQVIDLLEEKLGVRLPLILHLKIAMLMGAGEQGVHVIDPCPGGAPPFTESLDFEKLAKLLNAGTADTSEKQSEPTGKNEGNLP